jgi:hypothetical protein
VIQTSSTTAWPFAPSFKTLGATLASRGLSLARHALVALATSLSAIAAEPVSLSETTYQTDLGVILIQVNWGRSWKCGAYENAQLQALTFTRSPIGSPEPVSLELKTPSKLFVNQQFLPYAYVVQPGEYVLTGFDVKIARSMTDVAHIIGSRDNLIQDGKPVAGTFTVNPGEIVYIGHFGLDCGAEPFLWRYYIDGRDEFEKYVGGFRQKFPFVKLTPVQFRLFSTPMLGRPYVLPDPIVK